MIKMKNLLIEQDIQTLPELMYLLNQLNDLYWSFNEKSEKVKSPILEKAKMDIKEAFEVMIFSIEKQYPKFRVNGGPNGYNVNKK